MTRSTTLGAEVQTEEWRTVLSAPEMEASSLGRVRRTSPNHARMVLRVQSLRRTFNVARLVCEAFHGLPPADKPNVLHGDEDALNNRSTNLRWGTQKENLNAPLYLAHRHPQRQHDCIGRS